MSEDKLRIEFNDEEKETSLGSVAVEFIIFNGNLKIREEWGSTDELYGDGCSVFVSPRIWKIAAPWVAERLRR